MDKKIKYVGNSLFGLDFGLYDTDVNLDSEKTKKNITTAFNNEYKDQIKNALDSIGLKYEKVEYYSPQFYNYKTDSLDLVISVANIETFKKYVIKNTEEINKLLFKNNSYDGYIATTVCDVHTELEYMKNEDRYGIYKEYEPDIIVLGYILRLIVDFSEFRPRDFYLYTTDYLEEEIEDLEKEIVELRTNKATKEEIEQLQEEIEYKEREIGHYESLSDENKVEIV